MSPRPSPAGRGGMLTGESQKPRTGCCPATPPTPARSLTLQLVRSKEGSQAVFQGDDRPPKPAGGTGHHKPMGTDKGWRVLPGPEQGKRWGPSGGSIMTQGVEPGTWDISQWRRVLGAGLIAPSSVGGPDHAGRPCSRLSLPAFQSKGHPSVDRDTPHLADSHTSFTSSSLCTPPSSLQTPGLCCLRSVAARAGTREAGLGRSLVSGERRGLTVGCTP